MAEEKPKEAPVQKAEKKAAAAEAKAQTEPSVNAQAKPARKRKPTSTGVIFTKSKRKRSIARASGKPGNGTIRVNGKLIDTINPFELRYAMLKGVYLSDVTKKITQSLNITVNVRGGGVSSQAQAVAGSIARIIAEKGGEPVKKMMMEYDRHLIIDDSRRVEPKKFMGPKARARFQLSRR